MHGPDVLGALLKGSFAMVEERLRESTDEDCDLDGLPAWQLVMRPAGVHIRRHVGEYDVLLEILKTEAAKTRA